MNHRYLFVFVKLSLLSLFILRQAPPQCTAVEFVNVTQEAGVNYTQWQPRAGDSDLIHYMTGGAAAGDFDNDGWTDLFVTRLDNTDILYRNLGDGTFQDVSATAGFNQSLFSNGATWADIDNDGDRDLYVTTTLDESFRNYLYINNGDGTFAEEAASRGADLTGNSLTKGFSSTFGDYDLDGYLDLFTTEWNSDLGIGNSRLMRNLGAANPGSFEDVSQSAGVDVSVHNPTGTSYSFAPTFADMDRDGNVDLVIAGDFGNSHLFWNNGDGTFANGTAPSSVGTDENGMGSTVGDYDGDGDLDWFIASIFEEGGACGGANCGWGDTGNRLYQNNGDRTFNDVTDDAGVREGGWGWGSAFLDYDNDGDEDLAQTNGVNFPTVSHDAPFVDDQTRFWANDNGQFTDVTTQLGVTDTGSGKGLLTLDYDNDGDEDLFIVNNMGEPILYRNDGGNESNWLQIKAVGSNANGAGSNADGVGAQITVIPDATKPDEFIYREVTAGSNYLGQNDLTAHIGLGESNGTIDRVTIEWPASGFVQVIEDVRPNELLTAIEPLPSPGGDFNGDEVYDCLDIDSLVAQIANDTNSREFDLTSDGRVNEEDLNAWLAEGGAENSSETDGNPFLDGDANLDGRVDVSDFEIWRANMFTNAAAWCQGDFNADGGIDVSDFNRLMANQQPSSNQQPTNASTVPEPTGMSIFLLGLPFLLLSRRNDLFRSYA